MKRIYLIAVFFALAFSACKRQNIKEVPAWGDIFKKYAIDSGCFEIADNSHDQVFYYNLPRVSKRVTPASTFKIANSLIALDINVAKSEDMVIPWDGIKRYRDDWNKDLTMREAFKVSSVPYYQEIARRIGKVEMKKWIDTLKYGNQNIGDTIDQFWLNGDLTISPDEQVLLMKRLYFDKLPFSQRTQRIVRSIMLREDSTEYKLYFKTGTYLDEKGILAWVVGFIERKETQIGVLTKKEETNYKPYFFAMNFNTPDTSNAYKEKRINILKDILRERQIIK
ncbi:MAG: class D beta-lactamase [Chitinophagaceae bacterium]|nr:class D beta-lactamase [Chitinophagaceae bacterium]